MQDNANATVQELVFLGYLMTRPDEMAQYASLIEQLDLFKTQKGRHIWQTVHAYYMRYKILPPANQLPDIGLPEDEVSDLNIAANEMKDGDSEYKFLLDSFMETIQLSIYRNATEMFEETLRVGGEHMMEDLKYVEDTLLSQLLICRNADKATRQGTLAQTVAGWLSGTLPFQLPRVAIPIKGMENIAGSPVGSVNLLAGGYGSGKYLPTSVTIPTPKGDRRWGDLKPGDYVFGVHGKPTKILQTFPQGVQDIYKVTFDDGSSLLCGKDHLHLVYGRKSRRYDQRRGWGKVSWKVMTTQEIIDEGVTLKHGKCRPLRQWEVPRIRPVAYAHPAPLPLHPYVMGLWLGDGNASDGRLNINSNHTTVIDYLKELYHNYDWEKDVGIYKDADNDVVSIRLPLVKHQLEEIGVLGSHAWEKYIPKIYLEASIEDRIELLKGLMDSDGECDSTGATVVYGSTSEKLVNDVAFLVRGLGCKASYYQPKTPHYTYKGERLEGRTYYRINIAVPDYIGCPFRSVPKRAERYRGVTEERYLIRWIDKIEKLDYQEECMCIKVEAEDGLHLANDFIPTHNTTTMASMTAYLLENYNVLYVTLETNADAIVFKILSNLTDGRIKAKTVYELPDSEKVDEQERQIMGSIKVAYSQLSEKGGKPDDIVQIELPSKDGSTDGKSLHTLYHLTMSPGTATAAQLEVYAREIQRKSGKKLDAIMVDYAALMKTNSGASKEDVGWSYTGTIMMELSAVAQNLGTIIWTAAQTGGDKAHTVTSTATNAFKPIRGADVYGSKEILQNGSLVFGLSFVRSVKYPHLAVGVLSTLKNRYGVEFYDYICIMNYGLAKLQVVEVYNGSTEGDGGLVDRVYTLLQQLEKQYEVQLNSRLSQATVNSARARRQAQPVNGNTKQEFGAEFRAPIASIGVRDVNVGLGFEPPVNVSDLADVPVGSTAEDNNGSLVYDNPVVGSSTQLPDEEDKGGQVTYNKDGVMIKKPPKRRVAGPDINRIVPDSHATLLEEEQRQKAQMQERMNKNAVNGQKAEAAQNTINQTLGISSSLDLPI